MGPSERFENGTDIGGFGGSNFSLSLVLTPLKMQTGHVAVLACRARAPGHPRRSAVMAALSRGPKSRFQS